MQQKQNVWRNSWTKQTMVHCSMCVFFVFVFFYTNILFAGLPLHGTPHKMMTVEIVTRLQLHSQKRLDMMMVELQ